MYNRDDEEFVCLLVLVVCMAFSFVSLIFIIPTVYLVLYLCWDEFHNYHHKHDDDDKKQ